MKHYFMPYDPKNGKIICAQYEYHKDGMTGGKGMKKNAALLAGEASQGNEATTVWYDPTVKPLSGLKNRTDEVLIRGHGMPGLASIEGGRGGERVSAQEIAARIKASGLPETFGGNIVAFSCHSAESAAPSIEAEGPPFARVLANAMKELGYKSASYFGYLGAIDSFAKQGSQGLQVYSRPGGSGGKGPELGTAAMARVKFHI